MDFEPDVVRRGQWLYGTSVPCAVQIVRRMSRPGSGDYEDPPEIASDVTGAFFELQYHTPSGRPSWVGGGHFETLDQATEAARRALGETLEWAP
jgi:hypothetical protein